MDFINRHKNLFGVGVASLVVAAVGAGIYLSRRGRAKETLPVAEVYRADFQALRSDFLGKIDHIGQKIRTESVAEDDLAIIAIEYAHYIEQRTREAEREEYFGARESRQRSSFPAYVQALLQRQRQKQADTQALLQEQQEILQGLGLQEDDKLKVVCSSATIYSENVASRVKEPVLQLARKLLTLKTEYLRAEGERITGELGKAADLSLEELPGVLSVIVNEAVFSSHPEYAFLDNVLETNHCIEAAPEQLSGELKAWEETILPVYEALSAQKSAPK